MATFREQKRVARGQLHEAMSEPALYLEKRTDAPKPVTVRLHLSFQPLGDLPGGSQGFAQVDSVTPQIVFWNGQVELDNQAYVITKDMGAYSVENVLPADDVTTKADVAPVSPATCEKYGWDLSKPFCGLTLPTGA